MRSNTAIQNGAFVLAALVAGVIAAVCLIIWQQPKPVDFLSFWAAGKMVLSGNSAAIYDIAAHRAGERSVVPGLGTLPFAYPPPFALLLMPFSLLPFGASFAVWVIVTGALYMAAAR